MLYKLGAVPYLNALPLIHYLEEKPRLEPPAALARLLKIGEVDIATSPIVALFENPHYTLVPGMCIGANGPVRSVKVFFNAPGVTLQNAREIYLDMESRTSALLLKVLLKFKYGRDLNKIMFYHPIPPRNVQARLLIGDKAMKEVSEFPTADLGYEWTEWTGLPFVFAAWVSRLPDVSERAVQELLTAKAQGTANIASVVPDKSPFTFDAIKTYLENLVFTMGEKEIAGMNLFRDYLLQGNLINVPMAPPQYGFA